MKILIKGMREGLGRLIVLIDWILSPKKIKRSESQQAQVDTQAKNLKLYQFYACPFCVKTRRTIKRLNVPIQTRNAQTGKYRKELEQATGNVQVPCLRIEQDNKTSWMLESGEIIAYLESRFGK
jgi:glutaredoxin